MASASTIPPASPAQAAGGPAAPPFLPGQRLARHGHDLFFHGQRLARGGHGLFFPGQRLAWGGHGLFPPDNALPGPDTAFASPDPSGPGPVRTERRRNRVTDRLIHVTDGCDLGGNRPYGVTKRMDLPADVPSRAVSAFGSSTNRADGATAILSRNAINRYRLYFYHLFTQPHQNSTKTPQSSSLRIQGLSTEASASTPQLPSPTTAEPNHLFGLQILKKGLLISPIGSDLTS